MLLLFCSIFIKIFEIHYQNNYHNIILTFNKYNNNSLYLSLSGADIIPTSHASATDSIAVLGSSTEVSRTPETDWTTRTHHGPKLTSISGEGGLSSPVAPDQTEGRTGSGLWRSGSCHGDTDHQHQEHSDCHDSCLVILMI